MKRKLLFTIFFILFILTAATSYAQKSISGIVNGYSAVDSIYPTKDTVKVVDLSVFTTGDTVMIYQAKGAVADTFPATFPHLFGEVSGSEVRNAGNYEIILVYDVNIAESLVIFSPGLIQDYDEFGLVQLIKVPSYKSASVDGELTCKAWEDSLGGVLALIVSDTLFLNSNIDVSGKGFRGAAPYQSNGTCASTDSAKYGFHYFSISDTVSAGFKGEGIANSDTAYIKGLGRWSNAGGGGNARFSGGGGGANYGKGGYGGEEDTLTCPNTPNYEDNPAYSGFWNALGGSDGFGLGAGLIDTSRIFMGGSGGSGTYTSGLLATDGGNGGGIILILAKVVKAGAGNIIANGESVTDIAEASAGGGGGGGTVVLDVDSVIGNPTISLKGGDGGRVQTYGASGPGGGGGGGALLYHGVSAYDGYYIRNQAGGTAGYAQDLWPIIKRHKAKSGDNGSPKLGKAQLTGFLYNSITPGQTICEGDLPKKLYGSQPRGGNGTYTYDWKSSPDNNAWTSTGINTKHFQPPALTQTTYYRRVVTSGTITDLGNVVEIVVQDSIQGNTIFGDDLTTCIGDQADTITGTTVLLGGNNTYDYIWESKTDDGNSWNTITDIDSVTCLPGTIVDTTFVRRVVISGACYDTTANIEIIGLPQITDNILSADQEICEGQQPEEITGQVPDNGDGTYTYYWESRTESSGWSVITDSTRKDFAPGHLFETMYYRRVVQSDDCMDISDSVKINVLPPIENDHIITSSLIYTCYGTQSQQLDGSTPTGGDGTYTYQWEYSTDGSVWESDISASTSEDYQPEALTDTTFFRRRVYSGQDGCCSSISDTLEVNIYILPVATIENRIDSICSGQDITLNINVDKGVQPYTITYNDGYSNQTSEAISNFVYNPVVTPQTSSESMPYNYTLVSVMDGNNCLATDMTGQADIMVYGIPTIEAGLDEDVCELEYELIGTKNFGDGIWDEFSNNYSTEFEVVNQTNFIAAVPKAGIYNYEWKVTSWNCVNKDLVKITFYERPYNIKVSPQDTNLFFVDEVQLKGSLNRPDTFDISTLWNITAGNGTISPSADDSIITVSSLNDQGQESVNMTWTVSKGVCPDSVVNVTIKLKELFTPTGFTPNGDGENDYLKFNGVENSDKKELIIYNRWGTEVYSASDAEVEMGWDGKNNDGKELSEDTYYYILNVTDDGVSQTHKGFIVIKRF